jgi:hypothetical protein
VICEATLCSKVWLFWGAQHIAAVTSITPTCDAGHISTVRPPSGRMKHEKTENWDRPTDGLGMDNQVYEIDVLP